MVALTFILGFSTLSFANSLNNGIDPTKKAFEKWSKEYISYPSQKPADDEQGIVLISFDILEDGTAVNYSVDAGISEILDEKALEVVRNMPKAHLYENGFIEGTRFVIPVKFSIQ